MPTVSKADLSSLIGKEVTAIIGTMHSHELRIPVRVKDVRVRFGIADLLVVPVLGDGEQWIELGTDYLDLGKHHVEYNRPRRKWDGES